MFKDNLITLRKLHRFSQEEISERIGISRQAYGKWECGESVPDIEKCAALAEVYGVTVDSLLKDYSFEKIEIPPAPRGKHIFGTVTIDHSGQITIPKEAREIFGLDEGCKLIVLGDEDKGIALAKVDVFEKRIKELMKCLHNEV